MTARLEKLDGRHVLSSEFSHRVRWYGTDSVKEFVTARNWLWENYGPGVERDFYWLKRFPEHGISPEWVWHVDDRTYFLYLKDSVVTHFSLKYINT